MGLTYQEILSTWCQADQVPAISHAWLWDHMVPLRGDITGAALEAWTFWPRWPPRPPGCGSG